MPPSVRAVFSYQRGELLCYSLFRPINSLFGRKTFPVPFNRELACKILESLRELTSRIAKMAGKIANSLLFSLLSGNRGGEDRAGRPPPQPPSKAFRQIPRPFRLDARIQLAACARHHREAVAPG